MYCLNTAKLYIKLYPWYNMSPSVHKILIHGSKIINYFYLPIGAYSEEPIEAQNKNVRKSRLYHARKTSRENTMLDQMHYLLMISDPIISSSTKRKPKVSSELSPECKAVNI